MSKGATLTLTQKLQALLGGGGRKEKEKEKKRKEKHKLFPK
jgi:hypothetical protein